MFKFFVELAGTFFFLSVIIITVQQKFKWAPFAIGLALTISCLWGGPVTGGHFNPAVSTMFYLDQKLNLYNYIGYVISQIIGAILALLYGKKVFKYINH
tara:strand:- start:17 stop:313 length:297 start_codon:yes stop_codon:yes gene_type:complete